MNTFIFLAFALMTLFSVTHSYKGDTSAKGFSLNLVVTVILIVNSYLFVRDNNGLSLLPYLNIAILIHNVIAMIVRRKKWYPPRKSPYN